MKKEGEEKMDWHDWKGKRVYIILKGERRYQGIVLSIDDDFIKLRDKFEKEVVISLSDIAVIQNE